MYLDFVIGKQSGINFFDCLIIEIFSNLYKMKLTMCNTKTYAPLKLSASATVCLYALNSRKQTSVKKTMARIARFSRRGCFFFEGKHSHPFNAERLSVTISIAFSVAPPLPIPPDAFAGSSIAIIVVCNPPEEKSHK